jgi:hypothetical protein
VFCFLLNGSSKEGTADGVVVGLPRSVDSRSSFRLSFARACWWCLERRWAVSGIVYRAGGLRSRHRRLGPGFLVRREKKGRWARQSAECRGPRAKPGTRSGSQGQDFVQPQQPPRRAGHTHNPGEPGGNNHLPGPELGLHQWILCTRGVLLRHNDMELQRPPTSKHSALDEPRANLRLGMPWVLSRFSLEDMARNHVRCTTSISRPLSISSHCFHAFGKAASRRSREAQPRQEKRALRTDEELALFVSL